MITNTTFWRATRPVRQFLIRYFFSTESFRRDRKRNFFIEELASLSGNGLVERATGPLGADIAEMELIEPFFDHEYYLSVNPDVEKAGVDPLAHFLVQGWRELRRPNREFDVSHYLSLNPDVAKGGTNPFIHYAKSGKARRWVPPALFGLRQQLSKATKPSVQATEWLSHTDNSVPIFYADLIKLLDKGAQSLGSIVSVSHDDYAANVGGVQNVIGDEQRAFNAAGWQYIHLSPAAPLPLLAGNIDVRFFHLRIRIDGDAVGLVSMQDITTAVKQKRMSGYNILLVVHHLMGHVPEHLGTLSAATGQRPIFWAHDYFTLCPSYTLMRNGVTYCGAPPPSSAACQVCSFGEDRQQHLNRVRGFIDATRPILLAPSETTLTFLVQNTEPLWTNTVAVPPAELLLDATTNKSSSIERVRLKIGFLGGTAFHKGWDAFSRLALRLSYDDRYEFLHLGQGSERPMGYTRHSVLVTPENRNAMIEALRTYEVDVVISWSMWPETFCFTAHEALAAGAFLVVRRGSGHVWPAIQASSPNQGCEVKDEGELFTIFESGNIFALIRDAKLRQGGLVISGNTATYFLDNINSESNLLHSTEPLT